MSAAAVAAAGVYVVIVGVVVVFPHVVDLQH